MTRSEREPDIGLAGLRDQRHLLRPQRSVVAWLRDGVRAASSHLEGVLTVATARTRCPVCDGHGLVPLVLGGRPLMFTCDYCHLIFTRDRPSRSELRMFYASSEPVFGLPADEVEVYRQHKNDSYATLGLRQHEDRLGPQKRALDVGCALGANLEVLESRGWQVEGIDPNPGYVDHVRKRGRHAFLGDLQSAAADSELRGKYQLITMFHVVEHLADPVDAFNEMSGLLSPGGLLVVETPVCCDLMNRDHLLFFSGASLNVLLERTGFRWISQFFYVAHAHAHDNLVVLAQRTH